MIPQNEIYDLGFDEMGFGKMRFSELGFRDLGFGEMGLNPATCCIARFPCNSTAFLLLILSLQTVILQPPLQMVPKLTDVSRISVIVTLCMFQTILLMGNCS